MSLDEAVAHPAVDGEPRRVELAGQGGAAAAEVLPPSWVPAFPPRGEPLPRHCRLARRRVSAAAPPAGSFAVLLLSALRLDWRGARAARAAGRGVADRGWRQPVGVRSLPASLAQPSAAAERHRRSRRSASDSAGSTIDTASYHSAALARHRVVPTSTCRPGLREHERALPGRLPAAPATTSPTTAFLQIGVQGELDRLIARTRFRR